MIETLRNIILNHHKPKIYGAAWDKGDGSELIRINNSIGKTALAGVDMIPVRNDFDYADIYKDIKDVTDSIGNVFVRIPKIYIRKVDTVNFKSWQISKKKWDNTWYLPWCFWDFENNRELPYIDYGKYTASNELIGGTNRLRSVPDQYPLVSQNIAEFRTEAANNNVGGAKGYQLLDIHAIDLLRTLFFIEFATIDSQSIMGGWTGGQFVTDHTAKAAESAVNRIIIANAQADLYAVGQPVSIGTTRGKNDIVNNRVITSIDVYDASNKAVSFDGDPANIAVGNMLYTVAWKSGFSSGIAAKSGSIGSNIIAKFPCVYRGIENPYGNTWQMTDGINISDYQSWICKNAANYESDVFASPYEQIGYLNANTSSYVGETGFDNNFPFIEIPKTIQYSDNIKYKDYYNQNSGQRIACFGSNWYEGPYAGLSCWRMGSSSTSAVTHIGGRLIRKAT